MKHIKLRLLLLALLISGIFMVDGVYVGLIANESELVLYPWGTEQGWAYQSKTHYMVSGFMLAFIAWCPFFLIKGTEHLVRR